MDGFKDPLLYALLSNNPGNRMFIRGLKDGTGIICRIQPESLPDYTDNLCQMNSTNQTIRKDVSIPQFFVNKALKKTIFVTN